MWIGKYESTKSKPKTEPWYTREWDFSLPQDVLATVDYLIGVKFGVGTVDDIDHLRNRCILSVADLLQN